MIPQSWLSSFNQVTKTIVCSLKYERTYGLCSVQKYSYSSDGDRAGGIAQGKRLKAVMLLFFFELPL